MQGGTRSGKTYSVVYYLIYLCELYKGLEIDIVRDTFTALKATAWKDFMDILISHDLYNEKYHNKTSNSYILKGNKIGYYGVDNPEKVHGRKRDILWVNEAHQFPGEIVDQLFPRTKYRIICDFNPALGSKHWLDPYLKQYGAFISTYKDNPYLTKSQIEDIESRQMNSYWWSVYGKGERARREGVIFNNWEYGIFDHTLSFCYGLDWGYSPDPLAVVKIAVDKNKRLIYLHEIIYDTELDDVPGALRRSGIHLNDLIVCDTNEPRTKQSVLAKGYNIQNARKEKIIDDIREIKNYKIVITSDSHNLIGEIENYVWNDKKASIPVDSDNHLLDAMRYGFNRLIRKSQIIMHGQNRII